VHSGTSITATAPASKTGGIVDIRVTSARGTSSIVAFDRFTYTGPLITSVTPSFGRAVGGDFVTINGVGLSSVTQIRFGTTVVGTSAFTVHTATKIVVKSPAHGAGFVQLVATGNQGSSALSVTPNPPNGYTYQGVPTVTKLLPKVIPHGTAKTLVITGTGFLGATKVMIGTTVATIKPGTTATSITVVTKALPKGSFGVLVTTASGTSIKTPASTLTAS
ncbi:MAG: IPT/TIG domain-containing protein, partial [Actinomycetota bacterium]